MTEIEELREEVQKLEKRVEGLTKLINNVFKEEIDKYNGDRRRDRAVQGTSKLIIDKTTCVPFIFIARRGDDNRDLENTIFIDNTTRNEFFTDCKKEETINNDKLKWSIAEGSPDYEKWRKLFV